MTYTAWIRAVKEKAEETKKKYPNLAESPVFLNIQIIEGTQPLSELSDKEIQQYIQDIIEAQGIKTYPDKYPFDEKEKVDVVEHYGGEETRKVFEGEVEIPDRFQGENTQPVEVAEA